MSPSTFHRRRAVRIALHCGAAADVSTHLPRVQRLRAQRELHLVAHLVQDLSQQTADGRRESAKWERAKRERAKRERAKWERVKWERAKVGNAKVGKDQPSGKGAKWERAERVMEQPRQSASRRVSTFLVGGSVRGGAWPLHTARRGSTRPYTYPAPA